VVGDNAQFCEKCGYQFASGPKANVLQKSKGGLLGRFILFVLIVLGLVGYQQMRPTTETSNQRQTDRTTTESPIEVQAATLYADYEANEVAADLKYKGRLLTVEGEVEKIGKDLLDNPYVSLKGSGFFGVQCMFSKDKVRELAGVSKGMIDTIVGRCAGKLGSVLLRDCSMPTEELGADGKSPRNPGALEHLARVNVIAMAKRVGFNATANGNRLTIRGDARISKLAKMLRDDPGLLCEGGFTELAAGGKVSQLECPQNTGLVVTPPQQTETERRDAEEARRYLRSIK
jgi:hypothetical protein